ncbi:MAG TPA: hypothetical protein ENK67_05390, partial [Flavobacteriia bacterium]|nr:hypothetical protein [Flavobacteriia bacterium]
RLQYTGKYENGKYTGEWKFYHENGQLKSIGKYENGKEAGEWKVYYKNGQLYKIELWNDGKLMDIISCYDGEGNRLDKGTLVNGNGTVNYYDMTGKLTKVNTYENGVLQN